MEVKIPESVRIVKLEQAPFRNVKEANAWVRDHGVIGLMSQVDSGGKGEISLSARSIDKMLSGSALMKSVTPALHYAALMRLRDIIRESFVAEIHPDYRKVNGVRSVTNPVNRQVMIAVLYGCVSMADIPYRSKTTLKLFLDKNENTKAYSYEISNIEILRGTAESLTQPNCKISMPTVENPTGTARIVILPTVKTSIDVGILLNGVCDVNGAPLLVVRK